MKWNLLGPILLWGCAVTNQDGDDGDGTEPPITPDGTPALCLEGEAYPPDPVEPMALGEVLYPYSWPVAVHRGTLESTALDLGNVPCASDPVIDWSPFDVLLFVSIPAW
jgi:hypothetical protein